MVYSRIEILAVNIILSLVQIEISLEIQLILFLLKFDQE